MSHIIRQARLRIRAKAFWTEFISTVIYPLKRLLKAFRKDFGSTDSHIRVTGLNDSRITNVFDWVKMEPPSKMLADPTMQPNKSDVPQKQRFILSLHHTDARQFLIRLLKTNQMRPLEVLKTVVFRTCHLARFGLLKTMLGSQCATAEDVIQQVCHSWGKLLRAVPQV